MSRRNHVYFGRDPGSPPDDEPRYCSCGEELHSAAELVDGECRECRSANDESEEWIDSHERRHAEPADDCDCGADEPDYDDSPEAAEFWR